jgi:magnesium-transporting ATPase (P-type)
VFTFSSARKRMTTLLHRSIAGASSGYNTRAAQATAGASQRVYCKGAAEIIVGLCTSKLDASGAVQPLTDGDRAELLELINGYGAGALRAIGLAHRDLSGADAVTAGTVQVRRVIFHYYSVSMSSKLLMR